MKTRHRHRRAKLSKAVAVSEGLGLGNRQLDAFDQNQFDGTELSPLERASPENDRQKLCAEQVSQYGLYAVPLLFYLFYSVFVSQKSIQIFGSPVPINIFYIIAAISLVFIVSHLTDLINEISSQFKGLAEEILFNGTQDDDDMKEEDYKQEMLDSYIHRLSTGVLTFPGALNPFFIGSWAARYGGAELGRNPLFVLMGTVSLRLTMLVLIFGASFGLLIGSLIRPVVSTIATASEMIVHARWQSAGGYLVTEASMVDLVSVVLVLVATWLLIGLVRSLREVRDIYRLNSALGPLKWGYGGDQSRRSVRSAALVLLDIPESRSIRRWTSWLPLPSRICVSFAVLVLGAAWLAWRNGPSVTVALDFSPVVALLTQLLGNASSALGLH